MIVYFLDDFAGNVDFVFLREIVRFVWSVLIWWFVYRIIGKVLIRGSGSVRMFV